MKGFTMNLQSMILFAQNMNTTFVYTCIRPHNTGKLDSVYGA